VIYQSENNSSTFRPYQVHPEDGSINPQNNTEEIITDIQQMAADKTPHGVRFQIN